MMKTCTALIAGIFERICCFYEVFLMALSSTEQLFIETPLYRRFLRHDVTCVKKVICNVTGFTIFNLSEAATAGVQLEKVFLEISQNSQEISCGKVSFLIKLQA